MILLGFWICSLECGVVRFQRLLKRSRRGGALRGGGRGGSRGGAQGGAGGAEEVSKFLGVFISSRVSGFFACLVQFFCSL